jgi:hypothetical protein
MSIARSIIWSRIITGVEIFDLGTENFGGARRFVLALRFHIVELHARLFPGELAFAALAEGEAENFHAIALVGVECDRAACAPDEIAGVSRDHERGFS